MDNHKNSMASQTVITELQPGDTGQLYLYTFTGLLDKAPNHLTQFAGLLLRPGEKWHNSIQMHSDSYMLLRYAHPYSPITYPVRVHKKCGPSEPI